MSKKDLKKQKQDNTINATNRWIILSIILTVFALYIRTVDYDFTLDDGLFYTQNKTVQQGFKGIPQIFKENSLIGAFNSKDIDDVYRPITLTTFAIQKELFGINSTAGHFINVLLYALCGILVYSVLKKIFVKWPLWLSGAIAILFVAHPVHTEVVCSMKSRDELLSCLFGFLFLRSLLVNKENNSLKSILLPGLWIFLALLSKESSITFIAIAPLVYYFTGIDSIKTIAIRTIPYLACAGLFLLLRSVVLTGDSSYSQSLVIYNSLNGATGFSDLYGTRFVILFLFLKQLLFPLFLSWDYSYNQIPLVSLTDPIAIASLIIHLALVGMMIYFFKKKDPIAFGLLFYFATSVITNNFFLKIGATFAERFLFVPTLGFLIFIAGVLSLIFKAPLTEAVTNSKFKITFSVLLVFFCIITIARTPVWKNNFELYQSGVKTAPNSARANIALASEYRIKAETSSNAQDKFNYYEKSRQYYIRSTEILPSYSEAYYNLGVIALAQSDSSLAIDWHKKALNANPKYKNSIHSVAVIYILKNELDSAIVYLNQVLKYYPDDLTEYPNFSFVYLTKKDYGKAKDYAQIGIEKDPNNPANYRNMAAAIYQLGDTSNAKKYWDKYTELGGK